MTGLRQTLYDLKLHISTDRRIWSAAAFVIIVFTVWGTTGAWREVDPEPPEEYVRLKVEEENVNSMIKEFNVDMQQAAEERRYLRDYLTRVNKQVEVEKQEIDWHVDILVNKLNDMTEKVDGISLQVGASAIASAELEKKLKQQRSQKRRKKAIDRSDL
jgi:KaiC/GvpD/RAD55 family RecA-like ATPase